MILQCTFLPALICTYSNILKEYKLAQFHCYGRYLAKHVQRNLTLSETAELDADKFYKMHLPNGLDNLASATMVVSEILVYSYIIPILIKSFTCHIHVLSLKGIMDYKILHLLYRIF